MESVVKAVGQAVSFSETMSNEDEHNKDAIETDTSSLPLQSGRKRRHSSEKRETSLDR